MKMAAQVTVTAGRRGGASAVSRGWRWQLSHCAGEEEDSNVIITYKMLKVYGDRNKWFSIGKIHLIKVRALSKVQKSHHQNIKY